MSWTSNFAGQLREQRSSNLIHTTGTAFWKTGSPGEIVNTGFTFWIGTGELTVDYAKKGLFSGQVAYQFKDDWRTRLRKLLSFDFGRQQSILGGKLQSQRNQRMGSGVSFRGQWTLELLDHSYQTTTMQTNLLKRPTQTKQYGGRSARAGFDDGYLRISRISQMQLRKGEKQMSHVCRNSKKVSLLCHLGAHFH